MNEKLYVCEFHDRCSWSCSWKTGHTHHGDMSDYCSDSHRPYRLVPYQEAPAPTEKLWVCDHKRCIEDCPGKNPRTKQQIKEDGSILAESEKQRCPYVSDYVKAIPYVKEATPMPNCELLCPVSIKAIIQAATPQELKCKQFWKDLGDAIWAVFGGAIVIDAEWNAKRLLYYISDKPRIAQWLKDKGFIREKAEPLKVGDQVGVFDGSMSYEIKNGKLTSDTPIGLGEDGPMKIIAICEGLPTRRLDPKDSRPGNDLILRGQSGTIYFSQQRFVKRV